MRHVRMLGLCLLAALAVCAYAVSSASALPEWGKCEAKAGGKYSDSNCTVKAKKGAGAYEWRKGAELTHRGFTGSGGSGVLNAVERFAEKCDTNGEWYESEHTKACEEKSEGEAFEPGVVIECTSESAAGEATGKKDVGHVVVKFRGCLLSGIEECQNTATEGEVVVNTLKGELGYINKADKDVGILLTPEAKKSPFTKFECGGSQLITVGAAADEKKGPGPVYPGKKGGDDSIISPIAPINQMTSEFTQVYTTTEADENVPNKFEGKPLAALETWFTETGAEQNGTLWGKAGESITNVNTTEEPEEIKA